MTIKCYEFFGCKKQECIIFKEQEERNCWEIDPALTPCTDIFEESMQTKDKIVFCKHCLFYEHVNKTTK